MRRHKGHILLIETDDLIRNLLQRWLGDEGYKVYALDADRTSRPSEDDGPLVLIIVDLPRPRGARPRIQALTGGRNVPVLALSARFRRGLSGSDEAARRLGVDGVLPKPFTRVELLSAVSRVASA